MEEGRGILFREDVWAQESTSKGKAIKSSRGEAKSVHEQDTRTNKELNQETRIQKKEMKHRKKIDSFHSRTLTVL